MVELTREYFIDTDDRSYMLKRRVHGVNQKTNEPTVSDTVVGYYSSLRSAVKAARDRCIREKLRNDTVSLREALEIVEKLDAEFTELLINAFKED